MSIERKRKEIGIDLLGINALDPFPENTSSPRKAMMATHVGQAPIVSGGEPRRIMTGIELEYSQYTFDVQFPCDATVIRSIPKFRTGMGRDAIHHNPLTTIIYEDYYDHHKTVGVINVPDFASFHQDFGYRYARQTEVWDRLNPGAMFEKGERLVRSPAVRSNGQYGMGINASVAFMSMPGTIEDGFILSESFLKRMTPTMYNTLTANWGRKTFPLNLYGDDTIYKPFPDIGQPIREDGVVFAMRDLTDDLAIAEMTPRALREIDHVFDRPLYGKPGAIVADISVYHDCQLNPAFTPVGMDTQARRYYDSQVAYYSALVEEYQRLRQKRGQALRITPEFNQLLVEAQIFLPTTGDKRKLSRMYRLEPLEEWRVEITYEYKMTATEGFKFTDLHGGKGVNCKTVTDAEMPMDENGNRADVIIYGGSTIKRMNTARFYEQFINAAGRDLAHKLRRKMGLDAHITPTQHQVATACQNPSMVKYCWDELMAYYKIVAPIQYNLLVDDPDPTRHVSAVLRDMMYLYMPPDNPVNNLEMAKELLDSRFCPHIGPVTYTDSAGRVVKTATPVLIGELYMIMLEKTGEDWSGVASVKTNHFGVASKLNNFDKHTSPGRQASIRALGESETRSFISVVGPETTTDLLDQSNNPETHRFITETILKARQPTQIDTVVDRQQVPLGGSRPVSFTKHLLACRGIELAYEPEHGDSLS